MNKLVLGLLAVAFTTTSYASTGYACKISKLKATLTVEYSQDVQKYYFKFKTKDDTQTGEIVKVTNYNRDVFGTDRFLNKIMHEAGLEKVENFISATAYITDSNNLGDSGLMVFKAGRNGTVAQAYFNGPTEHVEKCK